MLLASRNMLIKHEVIIANSKEQDHMLFFCIVSQVHNFQKLKNISLKAVNFFSNKTKSNLFE